MHEHRDMLKYEIEQIGKVFAKIVGSFFQLKAKGNPALAIEVTNEQFKDELNLNIHHLINLTVNELQLYFDGKILQVEHLQLLTDYLLEVSKHQLQTKDSEAAKTLTKVLEIEDILQQSKNANLFDDYTAVKTVKQIEAEALLQSI